jgi:hypothetical protein
MVDPEIKALPKHFIAGLNNDQGQLFIIFHSLRRGVAEWMQTLEDTHYAPGTGENAKLNLYLTKWNELDWAIVGVPLADRQKVEAICRQTKMRLSDGVPHCIGVKDGRQFVESFPLSSPRSFTLENDHEAETGKTGPVVSQAIMQKDEKRGFKE